MDLSSWLEYFTKALESQMHEVKSKGVRAIKTDVLALEHGISERQKAIIDNFSENDNGFIIQDCESLFPSINRRSLQRDLSNLLQHKFLRKTGTRKAVRYWLQSID